jgi:hypothetical protein
MLNVAVAMVFPLFVLNEKREYRPDGNWYSQGVKKTGSVIQIRLNNAPGSDC